MCYNGSFNHETLRTKSKTLHPMIHQRTLSNGLSLVVEEIPDHPLVALNLWYHVGSRNERPGRTGFAHLFEHLLFEGSAHVADNEHFRYLEQVGAYVNGSTWYDRTNYYETLAAEALPLALWLESDRMGFFLETLNEEKLNTQRNVVKNERRWRVDNRPYGLWDERLFELAYPADHPYHHSVIGSMEDLDCATLDDVRHFFQTYYVPNNAVLTLVGGITLDHAVREVERYFGEIEPGNLLAPSPVTSFGRHIPASETRSDKVELARTYILYHLPPYGDPEVRSADLTSTFFANGFSSRLYRHLVAEKSLAVDLGGWILPLELGSVMIFVITWSGSCPPDRGLEAFDQQIQDLHLTPPSPDEIDKARRILRAEWTREFENLGKRADLLSMGTTFFSNPSWGSEEMNRLRDHSRSDVLDFIESRLIHAQRSVLTFTPESQ